MIQSRKQALAGCPAWSARGARLAQRHIQPLTLLEALLHVRCIPQVGDVFVERQRLLSGTWIRPNWKRHMLLSTPVRNAAPHQRAQHRPGPSRKLADSLTQALLSWQ
jgi:hypothetical protein